MGWITTDTCTKCGWCEEHNYGTGWLGRVGYCETCGEGESTKVWLEFSPCVHCGGKVSPHAEPVCPTCGGRQWNKEDHHATWD